MHENSTENQHFVAQAEQRLNALNPEASESRQRIYSFRVVDRDSYMLALENPRGNPINNNLSSLDLFSFDVPGGGTLRHNFEALFHKYEAPVAGLTRSLLAKLNANNKDIKTEIIDLFAAKLLNFVRNPYSVVKILNTFPGLAGYDPVDPALLATYHRIVDGRKPHQAYQCARLGIGDAQYVEWLRVLFMLLTPMADGQANVFDQVIKGLFEDRKKHVAAHVFEYDSERCLLSDRGYSQPFEDGPHMGLSFNLCATAFITYAFFDPAALLEGKASPEFLQQALAYRDSLPENQIDVHFLRNHREMLASYNRHVIEQCHQHVFCSAADGLVLSAV